MGKEKAWKKECVEKRARAERTLNEVVDDLAGTCPLLPEHLEFVRNTRIELACEEVPQLEKVLKGVENLKSWLVFEGDNAAVDICEMKLSFFKDNDFAYWFYGGSIIIGEAGETFQDEKYKRSMVAEVAHAISHTAGPFREDGFKLDLGVGEFYDYSLTSLYESDAGLAEKIQYSKLAFLYLDYSLQYPTLQEASRKAVHEVMSVISPGSAPLGEEDARFVEEFGDVVLSIFSVFDEDPKHTQGLAITWELLEAVGQHIDCSYEKAMHHLPHLACKMLYDNAVDHSDPERFVKTAKQGLPEYLGMDNG